MAEQAPCWYAVLGVAPTASQAEIKAAFRQAALRLHPDKAGGGAAADGLGDGGSGEAGAAPAAGEEFHLVQQAWEVLQDGSRRQQYDRQLALTAAAAQVHINETVPLAELEAVQVDGQACRAWPCRCGGSYLLAQEDLAAAAAAELVLACSTCSLHIAVLPGPPQPP